MGGPTFKDHFSGHAESYSRFRPGYPKPLFDYLAARAPGLSLAWDCATGNGQAARQLAAHFDRVIATDASAAQIRAAKQSPQIAFRCAPAEDSGLDSASVDLITVAQALHWLDFDAFYGEARRVLRPGGVLAAWCYSLFRATPALDRVVHGFYHEQVGPYWPAERHWIDERYATLPFPFPELPAPQFAMRLEWSLDQLLGYMNTWSAVRRFERERGHSPLDDLRPALARAWPRNQERTAVTWVLHLRVGRHTGS